MCGYRLLHTVSLVLRRPLHHTPSSTTTHWGGRNITNSVLESRDGDDVAATAATDMWLLAGHYCCSAATMVAAADID